MKKRIVLIGSLVCVLSACEAPKEIKPSDGITNANLVLSNTSEFINSNSSLAVGNQKILVVPCHFKDERDFEEGDTDRIRRAFFEDILSTTDSRNYFSVTEFYKKSSLGKLNITGEVTPVLEVPYTLSEIDADGNYYPGVPAAVYGELESVTDSFLASYDTDKDGFVDNVVFVYSSATSERTGNFWAWVATFGTEANLTRPSLSRHMWCGIDFFNSNNYDIDAHTIIHETGHLLGLRDYYPSDNYYLALGGHSMMDYNISDHDPYSKMLLDWADPIYYDFDGYDSVTINLRPFEDANDFILYKPNWNHSVMDEYLMIEYYTPTGLNELDAKTKYSNRPLGFTKPGIKIYHVDSRIAKCHYDASVESAVFDEYVSEIPDDYPSDTYYLIAASNSTQDSRTDSTRQGRYKQIALIENKQYNKLQTGVSADDDSLFYAGDTFDSSSSAFILNGSWNDKTKMDVTISVDSIDGESATITISHKGE